MRNRIWDGRGQTTVLFALAAVALLGGVALGTDLAVMYSNWATLQKAADAAALAGANYLPEQPDLAVSTAITFAERNGLTATEVGTPTLSNGSQNLTVSPSRTVPYYFGRVLGLTSQLIKVSATASVPGGTSCMGCALCGTNSTSGGSNSNCPPSTYGTTAGQFGLVPIGLQSTTAYSYNQSVQLAFNGNAQTGQWGPGNWGYLALGSPGGNTLRQNIADGYSGPLQVNDWVNTQTGQQVGNGPQGLQDRITAGTNMDSTATFANHSALDPRVVYVPLIDWNNPNGKSGVQVMGFAVLWLDSVNGNNIQAHFISQVAPDSLANTNAPYFGTRGGPILIK